MRSEERGARSEEREARSEERGVVCVALVSVVSACKAEMSAQCDVSAAAICAGAFTCDAFTCGGSTPSRAASAVQGRGVV